MALNIIFFGSAEFACPSLKALVKEKGFNINGVITQPDKPAGRRQKLTPPPIKPTAEKLGLKIWQPADIKLVKAEEIKKRFGRPADIIVVAAYGQILPAEILNSPKYGCLNVHASLLPRWRGAGAIQAPILAGETETGISIILLDSGLDTGPILTQTKIKINPRDTAGSLEQKLSVLAAQILPATIKDWVQGKIKPQPQNKSQASYFGRLNKKMAEIDWRRPAIEIERLVRAMSPWPRAWCWLKGKGQQPPWRLNILQARIGPDKKEKKIGEFFLLANNELAVQCGQGLLLIEKIQPAGKKPMAGRDFWLGYQKLIAQNNAAIV